MSFRVELSRRAEADVREAYDYIRVHGPADPDAWRDGLSETLASLERFPEACGYAPEHEFAVEEIRQALYGPYRILFTIRGDEVYVIAIRHGARQFLRPDELR